MRWNVGNGEAINFWEDKWIHNLVDNKVTSHPPPNCSWTKVADFIDQANQTWDVDKLRQCISEAESIATSSIPISISKAKDKRIWKFNKSGNYSVKSGYHQGIKKVALSKPSQASTSYSPPKSLWNKLWDVPSAPKICHFMWKVVKNWVASKANLFKRKCSPSPTCLLCNSEKESIEHILFHCPWTRAVWFGCGKAFWILDSPIHSADKWMEELLCGNLAKETPLRRQLLSFRLVGLFGKLGTPSFSRVSFLIRSILLRKLGWLAVITYLLFSKS